MKTAEEKAREASCDYGIDDIQHRTMFASGYLQGYNEAMRWRDPKEELPEDEQVLVKTDKDEILLVTYWVEKGDCVYWDAPVYNVIGWRPIE